LDSFRSRHGIIFKILSGEKGSSDIEAAEDFKSRIVADETALYFRALPSKSLVQKYVNSEGKKILQGEAQHFICCKCNGRKTRAFDYRKVKEISML